MKLSESPNFFMKFPDTKELHLAFDAGVVFAHPENHNGFKFMVRITDKKYPHDWDSFIEIIINSAEEEKRAYSLDVETLAFATGWVKEDKEYKIWVDGYFAIFLMHALSKHSNPQLAGLKECAQGNYRFLRMLENDMNEKYGKALKDLYQEWLDAEKNTLP